MSNTTYPRYIIAEHNSEPAPPEYMYYVGVSHNLNKGYDETALEECTKDQVLWDDDRSSARQLRSLSSVLSAYIALVNLGFENLRIFKVTLNYEPADTATINNLVKKQRIREIVSKIDENDANYLREVGVLDLTIVT